MHQQEGRAPLVVACGLLSPDEGLISLGRFCLLESPFLFVLASCAFIFLCRFTGVYASRLSRLLID